MVYTCNNNKSNEQQISKMKGQSNKVTNEIEVFSFDRSSRQLLCLNVVDVHQKGVTPKEGDKQISAMQSKRKQETRIKLHET